MWGANRKASFTLVVLRSNDWIDCVWAAVAEDRRLISSADARRAAHARSLRGDGDGGVGALPVCFLCTNPALLTKTQEEDEGVIRIGGCVFAGAQAKHVSLSCGNNEARRGGIPCLDIREGRSNALAPTSNAPSVPSNLCHRMRCFIDPHKFSTYLLLRSNEQ